MGEIRDCSIATGADSKIAQQEQGESTWDPLNASELAANSANGLIPSLIAWAKSKPPGNVARVSRITANIHGLHRSDDRRSCPIRRGMLALSCLVSVGIKGIVLSLGLAGSVCAAGFPAQEPPTGSLSATLFPSNTPQEAPGVLVSAPPANPSDRATNPATLQGQEPSDRTDRVSSNAQEIPPSIVPLPLLGAQPPQVPRRDQRPPNTPNPPVRDAPSNQPAQPRPAQPRAATDNLQQLQLDRDGLVTMHTNELDVRQLLELLSRRSGLNILVSPKVSGTVTANFEGVTLDRVLAAVLKLAHLVEKKEGSIHYIYTKQEIADEAEDVKKERILTKVYKLNYVRSDEMLNMIRPFLSVDVGQKRVATSPSYRFGISESNTFASGGAMSASGSGGGGTGGGGMGGGGSMGGGGMTGGAGGGMGGAGSQPVSGGNSLADSDHLVIQDYESNLKIIDQIISRIDIRPVQVLIEAVIISVDLEHDRELGVNFAVVDNLAQMLGTVGAGTALNGNVGFNPTQLLTAAGQIAQGATADPQGFTSATNGVKFGFVADNVTGFVRALETLGSTKVLASPRILVLNKQCAEIQLGARLGFQTLSQNFTSTIQQVQFLNTGTLLRLRPFVSDDGMVRMEIHPERSTGVVSNNLPGADGRADDQRHGSRRSDPGNRRSDGRRRRLSDARAAGLVSDSRIGLSLRRQAED